MPAPRSVWKGYLRLALISCPVALYKATSEPERISFNRFSRLTGNKVSQELVDSVTRDPVENGDVAKGIEIAKGKYIEVSDEELAATAPPSAEVIDIASFADPSAIGGMFAEDHYFLGADGEAAAEAFALIRAALIMHGVVAIAPLSMGTRERLVAIAPCGAGMALTTLRHAAEVRDADTCFAGMPVVAVGGDLARLAGRVVADRITEFDPMAHRDRYQEAIAELVRDKIAGRMVKPPVTEEKPPRITDLATAVRKSAEAGAPRQKKRRAS